MKTINVIKLDLTNPVSVLRLASFDKSQNWEEAEKNADTLFRQWIEEKHPNEDPLEIQASVEDGIYISPEEENIVFLIQHSTH